MSNLGHRVGSLPRFAVQENPRATFQITRKTFTSIEEVMRDNMASAERAHMGVDLIARLAVLVVKAGAQKRSMGPVAPRRRSRPELAFRVPVQRITGAYFAGWHVRRLAHGVWLLYNDTIESYLIEYGIFQRVRRPILKLSVIEMMRLIQTTKTGDALVDWIIAPRRDARGRFQSFNARLRGSAVIGQAGPEGTLP